MLNNKLTTTKKGMIIILIFYASGIIVAAYGVAQYNEFTTGIGFGLLVIGVVIALCASFKTAGWMGMTKERTN